MRSSRQSRKEHQRGTQCFAINCQNYDNKITRSKGITFHRFPNKQRKYELYKLWVEKCRRLRGPSSTARICSAHFLPTDINRTLKRAHVKEGAVPQIFNLPHHLQQKQPAKRRSHNSACALIPLQCSEPSTSYICVEHTYPSYEKT